jgi:hypothetical protein
MHRLIMATVILEIPDDRHEELKRRAAAEGLSVSGLLLRETERMAPQISRQELIERLKTRSRPDIGMSGADLVRAGREERMQDLDEWFDHLRNRR